MGDDFRLTINGVAEFSLAGQECSNSLHIARDVVVTAATIGATQQFGPLRIRFPQELGQLQQFLLEFLVATGDPSLIVLEVVIFLGGFPGRFFRLGLQPDGFSGLRWCLSRSILGGQKCHRTPQQHKQQRCDSSFHERISCDINSCSWRSVSRYRHRDFSIAAWLVNENWSITVWDLRVACFPAWPRRRGQSLSVS